MREIKFRAWMGVKMEYNVMAGWLGSFYVKGIDPKDTACMSPFNTIYSNQTHVMQFTGLHDKNGTEIFEGDILKAGTKTGHVHYKTGSYLIVYGANSEPLGWLQEDRVEVIGNIYENPELLK